MFRALLAWCSVELPQLAAFFLGAALLLGLSSPSGAQTHCEKRAAQADKVPPGCVSPKVRYTQVYDKEGRPLNDREGRPLRQGKAVCKLEVVQYDCPNPGPGISSRLYEEYIPLAQAPPEDTFNRTTDEQPGSQEETPPDNAPPHDWEPPRRFDKTPGSESQPGGKHFKKTTSPEGKSSQPAPSAAGDQPGGGPASQSPSPSSQEPSRQPGEKQPTWYPGSGQGPQSAQPSGTTLKGGIHANALPGAWVGHTSVMVDGGPVDLDIEIRSDVGKYDEFPITLKKGNHAVNKLGGTRLAQDKFLITKLYLVAGGSIPCVGPCSVDLKKQ